MGFNFFNGFRFKVWFDIGCCLWYWYRIMCVLVIDIVLVNCVVVVLDNGDEIVCFKLVSEEIGCGYVEKLMDMIGDVMVESFIVFFDFD